MIRCHLTGRLFEPTESKALDDTGFTWHKCQHCDIYGRKSDDPNFNASRGQWHVVPDYPVQPRFRRLMRLASLASATSWRSQRCPAA